MMMIAPRMITEAMQHTRVPHSMHQRGMKSIDDADS